jgi:hypothetical protein
VKHASPKELGPKALSPGQRAYEERRARKAGMSLEAWLAAKEARAKAAAKPAAKEAKAGRGLFGRLLERFRGKERKEGGPGPQAPG